MNLRKEESLAYIFDPISNTYIDDEDESLGNKLALSQDAEDIIKQIDDQFGPGTVFPASELPPKENPYKDFEDRNPAADGGLMRQNFQKGTDPIVIPKYPDLRQFSSYPSPAKDKLISKFQKDLKKYLLNEIKKFNKTALPKEKYQLIEADIHRAMGYNPSTGNKPPKSLIKYVKETINTLPKNGTWEINTTGKGQLSDSSSRSNPIPDEIKNNIKNFFRKNYKTKTL